MRTHASAYPVRKASTGCLLLRQRLWPSGLSIAAFFPAAYCNALAVPRANIRQHPVMCRAMYAPEARLTLTEPLSAPALAQQTTTSTIIPNHHRAHGVARARAMQRCALTLQPAARAVVQLSAAQTGGTPVMDARRVLRANCARHPAQGKPSARKRRARCALWVKRRR